MWKAKITKTGLDFGEKKQEFLEWKDKNIGKVVTINEDKPITSNKRKFFEGAIVPYVALQHFMVDSGKWRMMTRDEAREMLKLEFNPIYTWNINKDRVIVGGSTAELNDEQFRTKMIDNVLRWMEENMYETPDSEEYKRWEDSAPDPDEEYPQLKRLKETAERRIEELNYRYQ